MTLQLFWLLWDSTPNITALKLYPFVASYRIDSFFEDRNQQGMDNLNRFFHKYPHMTDLGLDFTENTVKVNHHKRSRNSDWLDVPTSARAISRNFNRYNMSHS